MSRAESVAVKRVDSGSTPSSDARGGAGARRGWRRHLEGWEPGLVAVFIAGSAAILAVPRPVEPTELPLPLADAQALARTRDADMARAREAEELGLDAEVRELGSAFRAFGIVDGSGNPTEAELFAARKRVLEAVGPALAQGDEAVLRLRSYQQRSFIREVRRFEATGEETEELRELGGNFIGLLRRNAWLGRGEAGRRGGSDREARRVAMDAVVLGVLFKKRWNAIVGLQRSPFGVSLDEERALFRFLLSHPIRAGRDVQELAAPPEVIAARHDEAGEPEPGSLAAALRAQAARRAEEQYRLKKIDELTALDRSYPGHLARGVALYRLGKFAQSAEAFRLHLEQHPDGAYALRAQNYLRAALDRARD